MHPPLFQKQPSFSILSVWLCVLPVVGAGLPALLSPENNWSLVCWQQVMSELLFKGLYGCIDMDACGGCNVTLQQCVSLRVNKREWKCLGRLTSLEVCPLWCHKGCATNKGLNEMLSGDADAGGGCLRSSARQVAAVESVIHNYPENKNVPASHIL